MIYPVESLLRRYTIYILEVYLAVLFLCLGYNTIKVLMQWGYLLGTLTPSPTMIAIVSRESRPEEPVEISRVTP